jgi:hypothetical protein
VRLSIAEFYYEIFNASATCSGTCTVHEALAETCDDSINIHVVSEDLQQYFAYELTLPTCNATNIATFAALDDDDWTPSKADDDDMASGQIGAGMLATLAAAFVALELTLL